MSAGVVIYHLPTYKTHPQYKTSHCTLLWFDFAEFIHWQLLVQIAEVSALIWFPKKGGRSENTRSNNNNQNIEHCEWKHQHMYTWITNLHSILLVKCLHVSDYMAWQLHLNSNFMFYIQFHFFFLFCVSLFVCLLLLISCLLLCILFYPWLCVCVYVCSLKCSHVHHIERETERERFINGSDNNDNNK